MANLKAKHLYDLKFVSNPKVSPDGRAVVAVKTSIVEPDEDNKAPYYRSNLYYYDLDTSKKKQLTFSNFADTSPSFSQDGKQLAFLSRRKEKEAPQLYVLPLDGGEAKKLTEYKNGVTTYSWVPDGKSILFTSRADDENDHYKKGGARTINKLIYKMDGRGFLPDTPLQIYQYSLSREKATKLSNLGHSVSDLTVSPDGKTLFYLSPETQANADNWKRNIWAMDLKTRKIRKVLDEPMMASSPVVSPDGKTIAFLSSSMIDNFGSAAGVWTIPSTGGQANLLSAEYDCNPSTGSDSRYGAYGNAPAWLDSSSLLINLNKDGWSQLTTLDVNTAKLNLPEASESVISTFDQKADVTTFVRETPQTPGALYVTQHGETRLLDDPNKAFVKRYALGNASEPIRFTPKGGVELQYWTLNPTKPRKDNALVLQVHGGPHTNYGYGFYLEFHILAAAGYKVVYGNPRGGSSFGNKFATAFQGAYGTVDADDVLAIAKHAKRQHSDRKAPIHLTGGSYGGFMTNWVVGHSTYFKSAVSQRSISNWLSFFGASDIGYRFSEVEVKGNPWDDKEKLWEQSPLKYAKNVKTPILLIHAEEDHRCPIEQAEQFFVALKRIGKVPVKLMRFPDEGHELSRSGRPDRRVERLEAMLEWFNTHS